MPETATHRLLPILQEGIEVNKMVLYRTLSAFIAPRHPAEPAAFPGQLAGAVINDLFTSAAELPEPAATFIAAHRELLDRERQAFSSARPEIRIVLTDTLRMQTICDLMAGLPDPGLLQRAESAGILLSEREMPLPHTFIDMARRLGKAHGLLTPPAARAQ
ncbi:MAG: hypothetical protein HGA96_00490 [Desulfobulbaceae bacterium]|nr:hypothetical protein [Desulfobulbaceae bacterium]